MGIQDVTWLQSRACSSSIFLNNCGISENLEATTCLKTVVGGNQGHASCKTPLLQQSPFFVSVRFHGDHMTVTKLR